MGAVIWSSCSTLNTGCPGACAELAGGLADGPGALVGGAPGGGGGAAVGGAGVSPKVSVGFAIATASTQAMLRMSLTFTRRPHCSYRALEVAPVLILGHCSEGRTRVY